MSVQLSIRVSVVAVTLAAVTAGCGGQDTAQPTAGGATPGPVETTAPAPPVAPEPSAPAVEPSAAPAEATSVPLLEGRVGTQEDPEAFELSLTDSSGAPVETLPAGDYDIRVQDPATLHNFHLTGPGVDESTPVPGTGEVVWRVTFTAGDYLAVCDPHPGMAASFTVT